MMTWQVGEFRTDKQRFRLPGIAAIRASSTPPASSTRATGSGGGGGGGGGGGDGGELPAPSNHGTLSLGSPAVPVGAQLRRMVVTRGMVTRGR